MANHGWVSDTPAMQAAVRECGHQFGWGIRGGRLSSDAPSKAWRCTWHPGNYPAAKRQSRNVLVKERRVARRHGGWDKVDIAFAGGRGRREA